MSNSFRLTISKLVNVWIGARKPSKIYMETKYLRLRVMVLLKWQDRHLLNQDHQLTKKNLQFKRKNHLKMRSHLSSTKN